MVLESSSCGATRLLRDVKRLCMVIEEFPASLSDETGFDSMCQVRRLMIPRYLDF